MEEHDLIVCEITKAKIEKFDFTDILEVLEKLKASPSAYMGKFAFMIGGYDDDPREIYEVDEVRSYFSFLDKAFPYWLFFMNLEFPPQHSPLLLLISCLVDWEIQGTFGTTKHVMLNMSQVHEFIKSHLPYFNEMMDKAKIQRKREEEIFNKIMEHVYGSLR